MKPLDFVEGTWMLIPHLLWYIGCETQILKQSSSFRRHDSSLVHYEKQKFFKNLTNTTKSCINASQAQSDINSNHSTKIV